MVPVTVAISGCSFNSQIAVFLATVVCTNLAAVN